jgi:hypothetical protein
MVTSRPPTDSQLFRLILERGIHSSHLVQDPQTPTKGGPDEESRRLKMPFCGNEQDRAQQHRVVLAGGHHEKKNHPAGKGTSRFRLQGPYYATSIGPIQLRSVQYSPTVDSQMSMARLDPKVLPLTPKFSLGGNKRKTVFRPGSRVLQPSLSIMTLAQHRAEAVISSACYSFCGLASIFSNSNVGQRLNSVTSFRRGHSRNARRLQDYRRPFLIPVDPLHAVSFQVQG